LPNILGKQRSSGGKGLLPKHLSFPREGGDVVGRADVLELGKGGRGERKGVGRIKGVGPRSFIRNVPP